MTQIRVRWFNEYTNDADIRGSDGEERGERTGHVDRDHFVGYVRLGGMELILIGDQA